MILPVASTSGTDMPPMSWEGIDHALNRARGEGERVSTGLADLEEHISHRMLQEGDLHGLTLRRWRKARGRIRSLRAVHASYRRVVEQAERLRAEETGTRVQAELTGLMNGRSVHVGADAPPGAAHGPSPAEHMTPEQAVARMRRDFEAAAEVVSAADAAWDTLQPRLAELEGLWREIGTLCDLIGIPYADHDALRVELVQVDTLVRSDPLSLFSGTRVETARLDRLRAELDRTRGELRDALRLRDFYTETVERVSLSVADVEASVRRARELRRRVLAKILSPAPPEVPDAGPGLRDSLAAMEGLREAGRWYEMGVRLGGLVAAVQEAADRVRDCEAALTGLLERRAELRGRLAAYRREAARNGRAEDPELVRLHAGVHWELWTAPCDLRAATAALDAYRRAVRAPAGEHTGTRGGAEGRGGGTEAEG